MKSTAATAFALIFSAAALAANAQVVEKSTVATWLSSKGDAAVRSYHYKQFIKNRLFYTYIDQRLGVWDDCRIRINYIVVPAGMEQMRWGDQFEGSLKLLRPKTSGEPDSIYMKGPKGSVDVFTSVGNKREKMDGFEFYVAPEKRAEVLEALTKMADLCGAPKVL